MIVGIGFHKKLKKNIIIINMRRDINKKLTNNTQTYTSKKLRENK